MRKIRLQRPGDDRLLKRLADDLNEPQRAAATAGDGYNLILAGPGSGKTRVITYRVAYLISRGVPAEQILLVTFTRRAAREMLVRLEGLIGPRAAQVWAGTFHHIGNRILRQAADTLGYSSNFTILDSEDRLDLIRLAMDDAGLLGTGKLAPKPARVAHLIGHAFNLDRPLAELVAESGEYADSPDKILAAAEHYARRKRAANCMDYDDLLGQWRRLIREFPSQRAKLGNSYKHILVDEMQDTNTVQIDIVESIARAGSNNLSAVGDDAQSIYKFRGANYDNILKFQERNPGANLFRLEINYRSTPEIVAFTNASISHNTTGYPKTLISARPGSGLRPVVVPAADTYEEADFLCQQIMQARDEGTPLGRMAVLYRNHHDSILLQAELVAREIPYTVRSGLRFFEQAHVKDVLAYLRIIVNPRDEAAWRRLLLLLPGVGPARAAAICAHLVATPDPLASLMTAEAMALVPAKGKGYYAGFVADVARVRAAQPEAVPAAAIGAIQAGGYPAVVRLKYERPDNRLADIDQLAVLAARYDSLERLIADLLLAGDVYGADTLAADDPGETLVLSTIHQAKGLEWSRVFVPRLLDDSFPSARSLAEEGGEEEERRVFYVAVTRAMDELWLTYPLMLARPGRGNIVATPSRFLTEIDAPLYESAMLEPDPGGAWSG